MIRGIIVNILKKNKTIFSGIILLSLIFGQCNQVQAISFGSPGSIVGSITRSIGSLFTKKIKVTKSTKSKKALVIVGAIALCTLFLWNINQIKQIAIIASTPLTNKEKLLNACKKGNLKKVTSLLPHFTQETINETDKYGNTPLHYACEGDIYCKFRENKHLNIIKLLLEKGAKKSVTKADHIGYTPLHYACSNGNLKVIELLLSYCTRKTITQFSKYGTSPLYLVLMRNNEDNLQKMVELLLPHYSKEDINKVNNNGQSILYRSSVEQGHLEIDKLLLKHGAKIKIIKIKKAHKSKRNYLTNILEFQKCNNKIEFIINKIKQDLKKKQKICNKTKDILEIVFGRSTIQILKDTKTPQSTLYFKLLYTIKDEEVKKAVQDACKPTTLFTDPIERTNFLQDQKNIANKNIKLNIKLHEKNEKLIAFKTLMLK